jgi:predicted ATPase
MWSQEALILAQQQGHSFSLVNTLAFTAVLHQVRRDKQAGQAQAEAAVGLATAQGFAFRRASGIIVQGWALTIQGQAEEGMSQIRQGLVAYQATGAEVGCTYYLALLAEAYGLSGQAETGLRVLAEVLALVDRTGERHWESEVYRLKGELLRQQAVPDAPQAEACFHQALDIARRQQQNRWSCEPR